MALYHLEQHDSLSILHLRVGNANAMNERLLAAGLNEARAANIKGLIIIGHARFFSAGLDLIEVYEFDLEQMRHFIARWENTMLKLFTFPMPVVAAINGAAAAGGCLMALACDYRVMADDAAIGMTGIRLGISLPAAALEIFRETVPAANWARVLYSGKLFRAEEAAALGLTNEIASREKLLDTARERLREFTQHAGNPAAVLKTALRWKALARIEKNADEIREKFIELWFSPDARKGIEERRTALLTKKLRSEA